MPRHLAIIMDGNGRWAKRRFLPRVAGHRRGVEAVRDITRACINRGIEYLTLFAFSSENWRRPADEISVLQQLFLSTLEQEVDKLHANGVRMKVIGDINAFGNRIAALVANGEALTADNHRLTLTIAANYGGRWDLLQAIDKMVQQHGGRHGPYTEAQLSPFLAMNYAPEPELFIRTGGEQRISNFMLWQLAYTELYFTPTLWPDFDTVALDTAIAWFLERERRFGRTSEQLSEAERVRNGLEQGAHKFA